MNFCGENSAAPRCDFSTCDGPRKPPILADSADRTLPEVPPRTTRPYARTMALDPKTQKVYLVTAEGTSDPRKKINKGVAAFYPNRYFANTFTVLTYAPVALPPAKETE